MPKAAMDARKAPDKGDPSEGERFVPISPLLIRPWSTGGFSVYLKQDGKLVLYSKRGETFSEDQRDRIFEMGVSEVYIRQEQKGEYDEYLEQNLGKILESSDIPLFERSGALYAASMSVAQDVMSTKLPEPLTQKNLERIKKLVHASVTFFSTEETLKHMAKLISHDYDIYSHSVNTMVLTTFLLQTFDDTVDRELLLKCGIGAFLHDFGKCRISRHILERRPETLTGWELDEYRTHPNLGVAMCASVPMRQEVIHCILFHHEQEDGKGYPSGLRGPEIPFYVKALSVCNEYDNMTTDREAGPKAKSPFEALQHIKSRKGEFSQDMIRRLILILADANVM